MTLTPRTRSLLLVGSLALVLSTVVGVARQDDRALRPTSADQPALLEGDRVPDIIVSPASGVAPTRVFSGQNLAELGAGYPFGQAFGAGVRTAAGDVSGDGVTDVIVGMGPGGGLVTMIDGVSIGVVGSGYPFGASFGGGVNVAVGRFNTDPRLDIVAAQASGGGAVTVFDGVTYAPLLSVRPFGAGFTGGVNVATGDFDGDGLADLIVGEASGPNVALVNGRTGVAFAAAAPFGVPGVFVAAGDVNNDGHDEAIVSPGAGAGPVIVYDVRAGRVITALVPYTTPSAGGVRVAATDLTGDGRAEILTVPGPGVAAVLKVFDGATFANTNTVPVQDPAFTGGVFVSAPAVHGLRFSSANVATFRVGSAGSFTVTVGGSPAATSLTVTGTLPSGVTFTNNGNGTATLAGTPAAGSSGTYSLTFTASNGVATPVTQAFTLTVQQVPAITSASSAQFSLNAAGTFTVTATGYPTPTLSVQGSLPPGVTFTAGTNGTATIAGTPTGSAAAYPLTITAANGVGSNATQSFVLAVVDSTPLFTSAPSTTFVTGVSNSFTVSAAASPAVTSISRTGTLPTGVTFTDNGNGTATLGGTPQAGTGGTYALTFSATNGVNTTQQSFTLTVNQGAAVTSANSATFVQVAAGSFTITTSGFPTATVAVTGGLPAGVTFTANGNGTGTLAGTPAAGTGGTYALTISASNGVGAPGTQAFSLRVNAPPVITSGNATTFLVGAPGSFTVTTTGGPNPATITRTGTLPAGVTFTDNGNGTATLAGTPAAGTGGTYPLTITANNSTGPQTQQNFTLTVNQAPSITSATSTGFTIGQAGTFTVTTSAFPTATVSLVGGALPSGVTFTSNGNGTATIAGTPAVGTIGAYPLTIGATNTVGSAPNQAFTLNVSAVGPNGTDDTFSNGVGNTQYSVGAGTPATPAVVVSGSVLTNDTGTATLTAGPANIASTNGGAVAMASNGSFLYTPPVGFAGPSDTFTYTVTDGNALTDTAVVTINMSGVVWYVNPGGAAGDGRSSSPFNSMTAASTAAQASQAIYVHAGTAGGATTLKSGQVLAGAGAIFLLNGLTIAATSPPVLTGTVTLANGVQVSALNISSGASPAVSASGLSGVETITNVAITGGSQGYSLTNLGGTLTISGGSITGIASGADVLITGGTGTINVGATITNSGGRSVQVQNRTGGTVNFQGAIADTGAGVFLDANTGSTITFTGGLQLATGTSDAFTATNGGTVTATQNNTTILNTIATTTGTALTVCNTAIGVAGLTFRSISAGTASPSAGVGVYLDNTGAAGGLTVVGNGSQILPSGGTIQRKTGADGSLTAGNGIVLLNTGPVSLSWLQLNDFDNSAIVGRGVASFSMTNSVIDGAIGNAPAAFEGPIVFGLPSPSAVNGVTGSAVFTDTLISGGVEHNVEFYSQSGTSSVQFTGTLNANTCGITENSNVTGGDGLVLRAEGTATMSATLTRCRFRNDRVRALTATSFDTATLTVTLNQAEVLRFAQGLEGLSFVNADDSTLTAVMNGVHIEEVTGTAIYIGQAPGDASAVSLLRATISGSQILQTTTATAPGIVMRLSGTAGQASQARLLMSNTFVQHLGSSEAVLISTPDAGTMPEFDVTLSNNHIDQDDDVNGVVGMRLRADQGGANLCANVTSNLSHHPSTAPGAGFFAEQANGATYRLERGVATLATPAAAVLAANQFPQTGVTVTGSIAVIENGVCRVP